ncbi:hypothetical protein GCM10023080_047510 [Streptomyces pseudoechinosporeus]
MGPYVDGDLWGDELRSVTGYNVWGRREIPGSGVRPADRAGDPGCRVVDLMMVARHARLVIWVIDGSRFLSHRRLSI